MIQYEPSIRPLYQDATAVTDRPEEILALRELRSGLDPDVFEAEVRGQRQFDSGPQAPEILRLPSGAVSFGRLAIGESVATIHPTAIIATPPTSSRWEAPSGASILKHPRQGISTQFREYGQTIVNQRVGPL